MRAQRPRVVVPLASRRLGIKSGFATFEQCQPQGVRRECEAKMGVVQGGQGTTAHPKGL